MCTATPAIFVGVKKVTFIFWDIQDFDLSICFIQKQLHRNQVEITIPVNKFIFFPYV